MSLLPNALYTALYTALSIRTDPPTPNDFHWAFHHTTSPTTGTKYHIVNEGAGWIAGHENQSHSTILKSFLLVGIMRIADVSITPNNDNTNADADSATQDANTKLDTLLRSYDDKLNDQEGITCRVWLLKMFGILYNEGLLVDVRDGCDGDMQKLEKVIKDWGDAFADEAARNGQPRPVETDSGLSISIHIVPAHSFSECCRQMSVNTSKQQCR